MDYPDAEISIVCVDDLEIRDMNSSYRGKDKSTNVLSFPMQEGESSGINPNLLGDLVISLETADREASESGVTLDERVSQLLIHGILHLIGLDHEKSDLERSMMEEKNLKLLKELGEDSALPFFLDHI